MKGLRLYLTPFAPDQSGAVSVLYELGGIIVICDAGGCAGNVCGFDEPRWFTHKSAVFSAGLRDMDAILGRDDRLVAKLTDTASKLDATFAAIIGTPVPSVIGTDYRALRRMAEKKCNLPILTVDSTGMEHYDIGAQKAYLALVERFVAEKLPVERRKIGVWGATPLDLSDLQAGEKLRATLREQGWTNICCYGMGDGLDALKTASSAEKNLVVSPSGLKAAQYLQSKFGTPYEVLDPLASAFVPLQDFTGKRVLVIDQQVRANSIRQHLEALGAEVTVATWFMKCKVLERPNDLHLSEEDECKELIQTGDFDLLLCDKTLWQLAPDFVGAKIDVPSFALSGRLVEA